MVRVHAPEPRILVIRVVLPSNFWIFPSTRLGDWLIESCKIGNREAGRVPEGANCRKRVAVSVECVREPSHAIFPRQEYPGPVFKITLRNNTRSANPFL
jgi:hypothetical protein